MRKTGDCPIDSRLLILLVPTALFSEPEQVFNRGSHNAYK